MFLDDFCRVAGGNGVGRYILCDNGVGRNDGIVADGDTLLNACRRLLAVML